MKVSPLVIGVAAWFFVLWALATLPVFWRRTVRPWWREVWQAFYTWWTREERW